MSLIKLTRNNILKYDNFKIVNLNYNYKDLHTCFLKDNTGRFMENIWKSSFVYPTINACKHKKWGMTIWTHDQETHLKDDKITNEYYLWKKKLLNNKFPIKYPVGYSNRNKYEFILYNDKKYDNLSDAFNQIHTPIYCELVKSKSRFIELKSQYENGKNLLIISDDLPHEISLFVENEKYNSPGFSLAVALNSK
jgi:hypothetical protein